MNNKLIATIKHDEGYREEIYFDTEGIPTGGFGHAFHIGSKLPQYIWELILEIDINIAETDYTRLNLDLDEYRKNVIVNMLFNLGLPRLLKFKKMLKALREHDYERAADEMLDSKWAKQVGQRAERLAKTMRWIYPD